MRHTLTTISIFLAATVPTFVYVQGAGARARDSVDTPSRRAVLAAIPRTPSALINITAADMPASPDILQLGKRSTRALEQCLANNAIPSLRSHCADLLGVIGDRSALPSLWVALEDWEPSVRGDVIDALAKIPDGRSLPRLLQAFARADENSENRNAILTALGVIGDPKAVEVLRRELAHPSSDTRRIVAFRALWRSRSLWPRGLLIDELDRAIRSDDSAVVYDAILRASELRSPRLVAALLKRIKDPNADTRNKAVYALGLTGDRRAALPLRELLVGTRDARLLNNIAFALERLDKEAFFTEIGRLAVHPQAIIRLNAAFVLGDLKRADALPLLAAALSDASLEVKQQALAGLRDSPAGVAPLLERSLGDPNPLVRRAAVTALAARGRKESVPQLEAVVLAKASDAALREEAIFAVHELDPARGRELVYHALFVHGDPQQRRRAAIALGSRGEARVQEYLMGCLETSECPLAAVSPLLASSGDAAIAGRVLRAWAGGRRDLTTLLVALRPPGTTTLALADLDVALAREDRRALPQAARLLADLQVRAARPTLERIGPSRDPATQARLDVARARLGDERADAALLRALDELPGELLPGIVRITRTIAEPEARARLTPGLEQRYASAEFPTVLSAAAIELEWSPPRALPKLLAALHSSRLLERELALRYLRQRPPAAEPLLASAAVRERDPYVKEELRKLLDDRR